MKRTIETTIEIRAHSERVWEILSATSAYPDWNPFIRSIAGQFEPGETIKVSLSLPGSGSYGFKPVILRASFPEIRWKGKFLFTGLVDGEHYFRLESLSTNVTRFVHGENFSGILVGLMRGALNKTKRGFESMNEALKRVAEQ
jgi:hypothetical protein